MLERQWRAGESETWTPVVADIASRESQSNSERQLMHNNLWNIVSVKPTSCMQRSNATFQVAGSEEHVGPIGAYNWIWKAKKFGNQNK